MVYGQSMRRIASTPAGWVCFGLAVLLIGWFLHWEAVSSDFYRTAFFRRHRLDFEAIKDMLEHDRSIAMINCDVVSEPETLPESPQRLAEYRRDLARLGCPDVRNYPGKDQIAFSWDINQASDIIFIPGHPKHPADGYGHIEGDWYLWYRRGFP